MQQKKNEKMNLNEFLKKGYGYSIKVKEFADKSGVHQNTLRKVLKGKDMNFSTAKRIVNSSDGMISYESLADAVILD